MFLTIVCLISAFISLGISFSSNDKIFLGRNNNFIKAKYKESYIKISKKLVFSQSILFFIGAIASYKNYRIFMMISFYGIMILGCILTILTFKKNH